MTTQSLFNLNVVHSSWQLCIKNALEKIDPNYLENLTHDHWLPGRDKIFNAFSMPVDQVKYILFGESPYPRAASANGYAFWDAAVNELWSPTGLSKAVNRATSLRNIIKMLLLSEGLLKSNHTSQDDIAAIDKNNLIQTNHELFTHFLNHGFLLLNATPVLQPKQVRKDALAWNPFMKYILSYLFEKNPHVQLILFGNIAYTIDKLIDHFEIKRLYAEHPYNISFIQNKEVLDFFKPLHLLRKKP